MSVFSTLHDFCQQQKNHKNIYWIAYSGGMDSHVLLSACCEIRDRYGMTLRAIHINHGLSAQAVLWAKHCANVCAAFAIPYDEFAIKVVAKERESIEAIARQQRYAIFAKLLGKQDVLLTAHHQDDQAETLLLQLFRGAGPKGLASMPMLKPLGQGIQFRPFLNLSRTILQNVARVRELKWIEDESNDQTTFTRNFIRHEIVPLLKNRWPAINHTLSRSATHCAEAQALLEEFAITITKQVQGSQPETLSVTKLLVLPIEQQKLILRYWISLKAFPLPDTKKLQSILQNILKARWDKVPCVSWNKTEIRRYRDDLYLMPTLARHDVTAVYHWQPNQSLSLPEIGVLRMLINAGEDPSATLRTPAPTRKEGEEQLLPIITITFRRGGEMIDLPHRGKHKLKHLFQEWGVPPWLRDRIPLLYIANQIIAVPGHWTHHSLNVQFVLETVCYLADKPLDDKLLSRNLFIPAPDNREGVNI